ncbi:MAG: hypothetical protein LC620_02805, partial [Halobacteriales archaeon]|nr:hypothetical protein [Halobacteriales archaeon]
MTRLVRLTPQSAGQLRSLPPQAKAQVRNALRALAADPTGKQGRLDVRPLKTPVGLPQTVRCRVGAYRIAFYLDTRHLHVVQ